MRLHIGKLTNILSSNKCCECGSSKNLSMDHIIPKSKGGAKNHIANLQVMCSTCNNIKGSTITEEYDEYVLLERIISCDTKSARISRIYGTKMLSFVVTSSVKDYNQSVVMHTSEINKLIEYADVYDINLRNNIEHIKLPVKNVDKYLRKFDPNFVSNIGTIRSYLHHKHLYIT